MRVLRVYETRGYSFIMIQIQLLGFTRIDTILRIIDLYLLGSKLMNIEPNYYLGLQIC